MDINETLVTAIKAALDAGQAILKIYKQEFEVEIKADNSPLTAADRASHRIIVEALETTPYPVLSEESVAIPYDERKDWSTYWLVDPLDGTKEFIKKNGEFTVNIARVEYGVPTVGIVYVPVGGTLYLGTAQGAWKAADCEGKSVEAILDSLAACSVSGTPGTPLRVVASKSHCNDGTRDFIAGLEAIYGEVELVSRGSSLKLCMIAEGSADIYPRIAPTMEWDTAAAHAVVAAAGGAVYEYDPGLPEKAYTHAAQTSHNKEDPALNTDKNTPISVRYNKENLLNPYFVVSGLHE